MTTDDDDDNLAWIKEVLGARGKSLGKKSFRPNFYYIWIAYCVFIACFLSQCC